MHQTESSSLGGGCGPGSGICHVMKCHTRHQSNRSCTMAVPVVVLLAINSVIISVIMMASARTVNPACDPLKIGYIS